MPAQKNHQITKEDNKRGRKKQDLQNSQEK